MDLIGVQSLNFTYLGKVYRIILLDLLYCLFQLYTVDLDNADDCAAKFRSNTALGLIMFIGVVLGTLMKTPNKEINKMEEVVN